MPFLSVGKALSSEAGSVGNRTIDATAPLTPWRTGSGSAVKIRQTSPKLARRTLAVFLRRRSAVWTDR